MEKLATTGRRCRRAFRHWCSPRSPASASRAVQQTPAYDMVVQAMGGIMSLNRPPGRTADARGRVDRRPGRRLYAAIGTQAALAAARSHGPGRQGRCGDARLPGRACSRTRSRAWRPRAARRGRSERGNPSITPFDVFPAADGCSYRGGQRRAVQRLCTALDLPALAEDARFATNAARCQHHEALKQLLEERLSTAPARTGRRC